MGPYPVICIAFNVNISILKQTEISFKSKISNFNVFKVHFD
uniref:Uncharacterized protein n=1 Tax=Anguilla anguilla TaxID=7936 RepID=A0A0E9RX65_ANGAN